MAEFLLIFIHLCVSGTCRKGFGASLFIERVSALLVTWSPKPHPSPVRLRAAVAELMLNLLFLTRNLAGWIRGFLLAVYVVDLSTSEAFETMLDEGCEMLKSAILFLSPISLFSLWGESLWLDAWSGSKFKSLIKWSHERGESTAGRNTSSKQCILIWLAYNGGHIPLDWGVLAWLIAKLPSVCCISKSALWSLPWASDDTCKMKTCCINRTQCEVWVAMPEPINAIRTSTISPVPFQTMHHSSRNKNCEVTVIKLTRFPRNFSPLWSDCTHYKLNTSILLSGNPAKGHSSLVGDRPCTKALMLTPRHDWFRGDSLSLVTLAPGTTR